MRSGFLNFEQVTAGQTVKSRKDLNIPQGCTHVEVQADTQNIRYTLTPEGTNPPAQTYGMILLATEPPKCIPIDDFLLIRFTRGAGSDAKLNIHYYGTA